MSTLSQSESRRLYSWWWDSHISPKNSKWLQDNLTDMDTKVKAMIKLIEEDADSFARRAEMYYKKRPELMKLVEEFYRAYRALAERYDHATGELRQAHRTMAEAFPNQVPYSLTDDSTSYCSGPADADSDPLCTLFDPEDLQKGAMGISSMLNSLKYGAEEETDSETIRKGLKQLKEVFGSRVMTVQQDDGLDKSLDGFATADRSFGNESEIRESDAKTQTEADILGQKIAIKDQEVLEKQNELEKLHLLMQNERTRFEQVEATLETLKSLHTKSLEEQRALTLELHNKLQMVTDLENEIQSVKEENKSLQELNNSSTIDVLSLNELKEKLEHEVSVQMNRSNELEEEVSRLKEEIESLSIRYRTLMERFKSTGLNPERFETSVKELRDQNSNLIDEKNTLHEKVRDMESSLSTSNVELEELHESCRYLHEEKSTLASRFRTLTENMQKLLKTNTSLENSLSAANVEVEELRAKSRSFEELSRVLNIEKSDLIEERNALVAQLESVQERVEILETRFTGLERKYADLEKEKDSTLVQVEQLRGSLGEEKIEHLSYALSSESRWAELNNHVYVLREECMSTKRDFEDEVEKAVNAQVEIFVLKKFIEDLEQKNMLLLVEFRKQVDASKGSDKLISELETENLEQQVELEFLLDEIERNKTCILEEENNVVVRDTIAMGCLSLVFENFAAENAENLNAIIETLSKKLNVKEEENQNLNENVGKLVNEMVELRGTIEDLRTECEESKRIGHGMEKQVLKLSELSTKQKEEIEHLHETNKDLEFEVGLLRKEVEEQRIREERLSVELEEKNNEFENWDVEAASFFFDLQISSIREVLLEEKVQELTLVCENLEDENGTKTMEVEQMKEKIGCLETENGELKIQLSGYVPVIDSLKDSIESLEQSIIPRRRKLSPAAYRNQTGDERDGKFIEMDRRVLEEDRHVAASDETDEMDETTRLRDMEGRVKAMEMAVIRERNRLARKRLLAGSADVDVLVRKRGELEDRRSVSKEENEVPKEEIENENGVSDKQRRHRKTKSEISEVKNVLTLTMKDIPLDRASNSLSRREKRRSGEEILGLWESTERDCSIEFTTSNDGQNDGSHRMGRKQLNDVKHKRRVPSSELQLELSVDKLAVSTTIKPPNHDENKANILKKIVSDTRKLTNLQTSVQNLKARTGTGNGKDKTDKSRKASSFEYEEVKLHLQEVEETITQRMDMNRKLAKDIEEKGDTESDRNLVTEGSEMIGRLQFEIQSAEYVLQKLEDETELKPKPKLNPKSRVDGARTGVLLRNFIFRHKGSMKRRKKACFCGCMRSSMNDA